jgi:hypothetical protein
MELKNKDLSASPSSSIKGNQIMAALSGKLTKNEYQTKLQKTKTMTESRPKSTNFDLMNSKKIPSQEMNKSAVTNRNDVLLEGLDDSMVSSKKEVPSCFSRFCEFIEDCSCFCIHRDTKLRQLCL